MKTDLFPIAILAGGMATRLGPLTQRVPKAMLDICGEPFIAHQLRLLASRGLSRAVICAGHLSEMISDFVGDGGRFGLRVDYSLNGPKLLGTGGAVKRAIPLLGDEFLVMYGDSYLLCDYRAVQQSFKDGGKDALMTVLRNDDRWDRSNVEFRDGTIVAYDKKNRTDAMKHVDYGLGVFAARAFNFIAPGAACDMADVYADALRRSQLAAHEMTERFYEIGSVEGLEQTRQLLGGK